MAYDIGAKIGIEGEKEFKKALSEINAGLRVTASELTLLSAKYSDNDKSVQALTAKNEVLEKRLYSQQEKIEKLRVALTVSAEKYGEADKRTMKWQESLNKAEAELIQMEKELQDNSKELETAKQNMEKYGLAVDEVAESQQTFGEKLSSLISGLGINLPAGADKAIKALDGTKASTIALVGVVAGLVAGFGKLTIETAQAADEILTLAQVTGLTTDQIQELRYAEELLDVSTETLTGSMTRMIRNMNTARRGTGDAAEAFKKLRIRITDSTGQLRDSEQVFLEVIDALGRMRNETERDALSMAIFGRSARELTPLIEAGSGALKEYAQQAHEMGYVMSGDTLEAFGRLDDAMQMFNNQTQTLKNSLAVVLLPVLTGFFEVLNKIDPKILATVAIIGTVATVAITVVKGIKSVTDTFKAFDVGALKTTAIVVGVVAALIALSAIIAVIIGKGDELNRTISGVGQSVGNMTNTINNAPRQLQIGRNALGTSNWRGGLTWVGEEGPELVDLPPGTRIYNNRQSMRIALAGVGGGDTYNTYNVYVQAKDLDEAAKVVRVFENLRQRSRQGVR